MSALKPLASALVVLVLIGSVAPMASAAADSNGASAQAYSGTHVSFGTSANAMTDYSVDGQAMLSSVAVQSASEAERSGLVSADASLSSVTAIDGDGLSVGATSETRAEVDVDGSASMTAHDNGHGILVVRSGDEAQYVKANLSDGASASSSSDGRVTVTTADGVEGTFVVVGDGQVAVNEEGDVVAKLGEDGTLVFRAYPDGKTESDAATERLIADGQAAGEVHVMAEGGEAVTDTVIYDDETTVETTQTAENSVNVTVDRASHEGKVVIASVSEEAMDVADDASVRVDGRAAARASSYSELRSAIGGDRSKFLVQSASEAEGSADVLVAVNHFSERTIEVNASGEASGGSDGGSGNGTSTSDGSTTAGDGDGSTSTPGQPGFGAAVAVLALLGAAALARIRG